MKVAPEENQEETKPVWKNYPYTELFATIIPLPMFLKTLRGKLQQLFNHRAYSIMYWNMTYGEIAFFLISFSGMGIYFGFAYDNPWRSGWAASVPLLFCVIFSVKNSVLYYIFGICYERSVFWHKAFAWMTVLGGILHFAALPRLSDTTNKDYSSGWLMIASIFFLLIFSLPPIRHYFYEVFIRLHWVGFVAAMVGIFYHKIVLGYISVGYWGLDQLIKLFVIYRHAKNTTEITVSRSSPYVLRMDLSRNDFPFLSGQYVYVCIPQLSYFEWHPFGIQSSGGQNRITLYLKICGDWTRQLGAIADKNSGTVKLKAYFSGPFGFPSIDVVSDYYKSFLLIGGGIGMAPIISVCKAFLEQRKGLARPLTKLMLVWTTRDKGHFQDFINEEYLQSIISAEDKEAKLFETHYHFTGDAHPQTDIETSQIKQQEDQTQGAQFIHSRPDVAKYMQMFVSSAKEKGEKRAAILVCGPDGLIMSVQHQAKQQSTSDFCIDVHEVAFQI